MSRKGPKGPGCHVTSEVAPSPHKPRPDPELYLCVVVFLFWLKEVSDAISLLAARRDGFPDTQDFRADASPDGPSVPFRGGAGDHSPVAGCTEGVL